MIYSDFGNATRKAFEGEDGIWSTDKVGTYLLYPYCAGMSLPFENSTFWNSVKLSYLWQAASKSYLNTSYAQNTSRCIDHFYAIPMLNVILENINLMKSKSYSKLVFHSIHDTTIELLLKALGLWNDQLVIFGEMITLEIYSRSNHNNEYYFRITRLGKFVPHPLCQYDDNSELCDLDILLKDSFNDIVNQSVWSNEMCANLISDCKCGYCMETTPSPTKPDEDDCDTSVNKTLDATSASFWGGIVIGIIVGVVLITLCGIIHKKYFNKREKMQDTNYFMRDTAM